MATGFVAVARLLVHEGARLAKGFVLLAIGPACAFGGLHNVPIASVSVAVARLLVHKGARLAKGFVFLAIGPACVFGGILI